jgi:hypothetical protein
MKLIIPVCVYIQSQVSLKSLTVFFYFLVISTRGRETAYFIKIVFFLFFRSGLHSICFVFCKNKKIIILIFGFIDQP